jgi:cytochrome c oxidase subunit 1
MHWLGLITHSRVSNVTQLHVITILSTNLRSFITVASILTIATQGIFLFNFLWSLLHGEKTKERNPWRATTLEWSLASPPPFDDFGPSEPVVYRGAYEFSLPGVAQDFVPQHLAPEQVAKVR